MFQPDFDAQMARLKKAYGQQMNDELGLIFWDRFRNFEKVVFKTAVDHMIEERVALKVSTFAEAVNVVSRRMARPMEGAREVECGRCDKAAMLYARAKVGTHRFFVYCDCEWGRNGVGPLPVWQPAMAQDFTLEPVDLRRPDLSVLHDDKTLKLLDDDSFFRHPKVVRFMDHAREQDEDWWRAQREIAEEFWHSYHKELGLSPILPGKQKTNGKNTRGQKNERR